MRSQALKGRHNLAQGIGPVYGIVTIQQVVFLYTQWIKSTVKFFNNWEVPIFPKFPYPPTTFYSTRISESSFESNTLKINK